MIIHQLNLNSMAWYRMLVLNGNRMDDNHDDIYIYNRMIGILKHQARHAIFSSSGWLSASNINKDRCQQVHWKLQQGTTGILQHIFCTNAKRFSQKIKFTHAQAILRR